MLKKLNQIKPQEAASLIEVKVYRKWTNRHPFDSKPTGYCCMLLDMERNAIQVNMDFTDKDYFDKLIDVNGCYKITDYISEHGKQWMMTVQHKTTLKFGKFTKFEQIPDNGFPLHYFDFLSYNQLHVRLNEHRVLTDYMACLLSASEIQKSRNPNRSTHVWRIMELENLNGDTIELSIWDEMAQKFDVEEFNSLPKPVLAAVSSCRMSMFQDDIQLTGTPSTHYYLNPDIEDVQVSITEYQAMYGANPLLAIQNQPFKDVELEKMRNRYPLRTLLNQNPKRYKVKQKNRLTTEATIVDFNTNLDWFYIACPDCSKKLTCTNGLLKCHNHGPIKKDPKHVFSFKAFIRDETTQIAVTFFSPMADALINVNCNTMVTELGFTDPKKFPEPLIKLIGVKWIFQFHFNQRSAVGNVDFVLDKIVDISDVNQVEKQTTSLLHIPPDKETTSQSSMPDKRKSAPATETSKAKYVKREVIQKQGHNQSFKKNVGGKKQHELVINTSQENRTE